MALISVFTAEPGKGKTEAAVLRVGRNKAVFFCPTPTNKNKRLSAIPWAYASEVLALKEDELAQFQKENPRVRLIFGPEEASMLRQFMGHEWDGYIFVLDDLPQLVPEPRYFSHVIAFIAGIRHRDGKAIITTQRVLGVTPTFVRTVADEIAQVGPLVAQDEARTLYMMGGSARYAHFRDFYKAISTNPPYTLFPIKEA